MGGPGSGRYRAMRSIWEARCLDIGELADRGRYQRIPAGRILWRSADGRTLARLSYRFGEQHGADAANGSVLDYRYRCAEGGAGKDRLALRIVAGKAIIAYCPGEGCGRAVRRLYALPGQGRFLCRRCRRLSYPRSPAERVERYASELFGPLYKWVLEPGVAQRRLPRMSRARARASLEELWLDFLPRPQEERLICLYLGAARLSCRQIAAETGVSKSSVARLLAGGGKGIDLAQLITERARFYPKSSLQLLAALREVPRQTEVKLLLPLERPGPR